MSFVRLANTTGKTVEDIAENKRHMFLLVFPKIQIIASLRTKSGENLLNRTEQKWFI